MSNRKAAVRRLIIVCAVAMPMAAMAEPGPQRQPQLAEPGIEAEVEQCRKDCMETACATQFRTCANASGEASQTCKTLRDDCERRCVEVDCMT